MLPAMFIKMCVKLKHIHLASYVEVEELTSKVNAVLRETYIMSKFSFKLCKFFPWISFELLGFRLRENYRTLQFISGWRQGKWRTLSPKKLGRVRGLRKKKKNKKKLGENPEVVSNNFADFAVVKACLQRVNWQI